MKKLLSILVLLLATSAVAQETYSVNIVSATSVAKLDLGRTQWNTGVCTSLSLLSTCTQGQACVAKGVVGGAACTAGDALAAGVRIYPATQGGREGFVTNELVRAALPAFVLKQAETGMFTLKTFCQAANQTQQDAVCTSSGQSAGCGLCDAFR